MKIKVKALFLLFFVLMSLNCSVQAETFKFKNYIDESNEILLPKELSSQMNSIRSFPYLWWNFIVIENVNDDNDSWAKVDKLCQDYKEKSKKYAELLSCGNDLSQYKLLLEDWGRDFILRNKAPHLNKLKEVFKNASAKMAILPAPLISLLRLDPFESFRDFIKIKEAGMPLSFEKKNSYLYLRDKKFALIPILMNYDPEQIEKTKEMGLNLLGPHQSFLENKEQILKDSYRISIFGAVLMTLFCFFFVWTRRYQILFVLPVLFFSILLSSILVILIDGSIHGITLGFGTGIVGLAFDYGLHAFFTNNRKTIWRSNLYGLFTTLAVLVSIMFSSIPILKQMMMFASFGLIISYALLFLMDLKWKNIFWMESFKSINFFQIKNKKHLKYHIFLNLFLVILAFILALKLQLDFSMKNFDYKTLKQLEYQKAIYAGLKNKIVFSIQKDKNDPLSFEKLKKEKDLEVNNPLFNSKLDGLFSYIKSQEEMRENLMSWKNLLLEMKKDSSSLNSFKELFSPFISNIEETSIPDNYSSLLDRSYLKPYMSTQGNSLLSVWKLSSDEELNSFKKIYPESIVLQDSPKKISAYFISDLKILIPISFISVFLFLLYYYRSFSLSLMALSPLMFSLILLIYTFFLLGKSINFISLISLLIIYGMSVDYGIFATDLYHKKSEKFERIGNALFFSGVSTVVGCCPMLIAKHQILYFFGLSLSLGVLGTLFGTFYLIPILSDFLSLRKNQRGQ